MIEILELIISPRLEAVMQLTGVVPSQGRLFGVNCVGGHIKRDLSSITCHDNINIGTTMLKDTNT